MTVHLILSHEKERKREREERTKQFIRFIFFFHQPEKNKCLKNVVRQILARTNYLRSEQSFNVTNVPTFTCR